MSMQIQRARAMGARASLAAVVRGCCPLWPPAPPSRCPAELAGARGVAELHSCALAIQDWMMLANCRTAALHHHGARPTPAA